METTNKITLDTPIKNINFNCNDTRIQNALSCFNVKTVGDLVKLTRDELKEFRWLGPQSIRAIEDWLEEHNLSLADEQRPYRRLALTPLQWEQRRYEVAKEILKKTVFTSLEGDKLKARRDEVFKAINAADVFINELRTRDVIDFEDGIWE